MAEIRSKSDLLAGNRLGVLADPNAEMSPVDVTSREPGVFVRALRDMLVIRYAEEAIAELVEKRAAKCPCHLGIGQEAIPVGISASLQATDRVFGAHRSHSHYLALGGSLDALMCEVLGKESGCSNGMGGSMHLYGAEVGFHGSVPIVAGTVPIAVGAALAAKKDGGNDIAVAYFGDGASEEGGVHEALNLAACYDLPVLFVCENNLYSSHLDINLRQPSDRVARFGEAHCMDTVVIDGNNFTEVMHTAENLISGIRSGSGPAFLEAVTYRWRGHVGPNEDVDVGIRRSQEDLKAWKQRDPVARLRTALLDDASVTEAELQKIDEEIRKQVAGAVRVAEAAPYPSENALLKHVYAEQG